MKRGLINPKQFICEELKPAAGTADASAMVRREPGLPTSFTWRGVQYKIAGVTSQWKSHGHCRSSSKSKEMYLRRHWYIILTDPPIFMTIYCDRQARNRSKPKSRWFVHTIEQIEDQTV